jgi:hypothetical protein
MEGMGIAEMNGNGGNNNKNVIIQDTPLMCLPSD